MDCTSAADSRRLAAVPQSKKFPEDIAFQATEGTIARCAEHLEPGETKGAFYRAALENEIKRRKRRSKGDPS